MRLRRCDCSFKRVFGPLDFSLFAGGSLLPRNNENRFKRLFLSWIFVNLLVICFSCCYFFQLMFLLLHRVFGGYGLGLWEGFGITLVGRIPLANI